MHCRLGMILARRGRDWRSEEPTPVGREQMAGRGGVGGGEWVTHRVSPPPPPARIPEGCPLVSAINEKESAEKG